MNKKILLSSPHMSEEGYEKDFVKQAFDTNWIAPLGENVDRFEIELANKVGIKHAAALSSGTAAIHLALRAVGVKSGDVVICQSLTFSATANPIIYEGALPVFVDSDLETWNMDPNQLKLALKKYPNAKAVLVVHLYGLPANLDEIMSICVEYGVPLIEDAAESLGSLYKGKFTGTFGKCGIFSFNGNKIITTSGGGMLISDDQNSVDKARFWATQSRDKARHYQHSELGFNYRMSNIVAGIGRGQLKILEDRIAKKRYIYKFYKNELKRYKQIEFMPENPDSDPNFWLSCITFNNGFNPVILMEALEKENIESRPIWKPMHRQPFFEKYDYIGTGISDNLFSSGLCLPSDTKMTDEDLERVVSVIIKVLDSNE